MIVQIFCVDLNGWTHGLEVDLPAAGGRDQGQVEPLRSFYTEVAVVVICKESVVTVILKGR